MTEHTEDYDDELEDDEMMDCDRCGTEWHRYMMHEIDDERVCDYCMTEDDWDSIEYIGE